MRVKKRIIDGFEDHTPFSLAIVFLLKLQTRGRCKEGPSS